MQEEAIKRVQEMQRRSRNLVSGSKQQPEQSSVQPDAKPNTNNKVKSTDPINELLGSLFGKKQGVTEHASSNLFSIGNIQIDEEKALIALMIYILFKNGSDIKLLLGLGYLLI